MLALQLRCKIVALNPPDICLVTSRKYISGIPAEPHTGYALHSAGMIDFPVQTNQSLAIRVCQTEDQCRHQTIVMYKIKKKETLANTIKKVLAGIIKLSWPTEKNSHPTITHC